MNSNLCLQTCNIYLDSAEKLCVLVYNLTWTVPFDKGATINLCRLRQKHCEKWTDQDIGYPPIVIQPENRNYTVNIEFHCNFERKVINNQMDNKVFLKIPSSNCAKKYCLYDIKDNSKNNLRIDLTSIRLLSTKIEGLQYNFQICKINVPENNVCGNSTLSCTIDQLNSKISPLGNNNNWEIFYNGVEKGLQLTLHVSKKFKILIQINCDPNIMHSPHFSFVRKHGKQYLFNLISNKLCIKLPLKFNTHVQTEQNYVYDFSGLQGPNWRVPLPDHTDIIFTIGDSIQDDKNLNFGDRNIFACRNTTDKCISLGSVTTGFTFNNSHSQLFYTNGDMCQNGELASLRIQFLCSYKLDNPQILSISENCSTYEIIWKTSFGCPHVIGIPGDCSVRDNVVSLTSYDFSMLKNQNEDYQLELSHGNLRINLCGTLMDGSCGQTVNTSVCFERSSDGLKIPFGPVNTAPTFIDGKIEFVYSSNQKCNSNSNYTVRLHMICNTNETRNNSLTVLKEPNHTNNCDINLEWRTYLACYRPHSQTMCKVPGTNLDFQRLIRTEVNYKVPYKNVTFILNICKPVIFNENAFYLSFPGVIMVDNTDANIRTKVTNLGDVNGPIYNRNSKIITMEYSNKYSDKKSILYFYCNRNNKIPDIQVKIHKNIYNFLIFTNESCANENDQNIIDVDSIVNNLNDSIVDHVIESPPISSDIHSRRINCSIVSEINNFTMKTFLMNYSYNETQQLTFDNAINSKVANIYPNLRNICNKLIFNTTHNIVFDYVQEFYNNQKGINIELKLYCNYTAGIGMPKLMISEYSNYIYHWSTTIFCPETNAIYDQSTLLLKNPILSRELDFRQLLGSSNELIKIKTSKSETTVNFKAAKYNSILNYQDNVVEFNVYQLNDGCFNQNSTTRFNLICDLDKTTFEVKQETKCFIEFDWYIRDACYILGLESTLTRTKNLPIFDIVDPPTQAASLSTSLIFNICLAILLILLCPLIFYIYKKRYHFVLRGTSNGGYLQDNESTL